MSKGNVARGEKSKAIRQALETHPQLKNRELAAMLVTKGIKCSSQDIANQKARNKRMGGEDSTITLDGLIKIKSLVQEAGGFKVVMSKITYVDDLASKVGGMAKLRRGLEVLPQLQS